eukprot:4905597-Prymnesium_polylepis.1
MLRVAPWKRSDCSQKVSTPWKQATHTQRWSSTVTRLCARASALLVSLQSAAPAHAAVRCAHGFYLFIPRSRATAVWSMSGEVKLVDGPKRITLFRQKKQQLHCHTAGPESYLLIKKTDGSTEHVPGPCSRFPHPTEEVSIEVKPAVVISANEALVVSKQSTGNSKSGDNHGLEMRI